MSPPVHHLGHRQGGWLLRETRHLPVVVGFLPPGQPVVSYRMLRPPQKWWRGASSSLSLGDGDCCQAHRGRPQMPPPNPFPIPVPPKSGLPAKRPIRFRPDLVGRRRGFPRRPTGGPRPPGPLACPVHAQVPTWSLHRPGATGIALRPIGDGRKCPRRIHSRFPYPQSRVCPPYAPSDFHQTWWGGVGVPPAGRRAADVRPALSLGR